MENALFFSLFFGLAPLWSKQQANEVMGKIFFKIRGSWTSESFQEGGQSQKDRVSVTQKFQWNKRIQWDVSMCKNYEIKDKCPRNGLPIMSAGYQVGSCPLYVQVRKGIQQREMRHMDISVALQILSWWGQKYILSFKLISCRPVKKELGRRYGCETV